MSDIAVLGICLLFGVICSAAIMAGFATIEAYDKIFKDREDKK